MPSPRYMRSPTRSRAKGDLEPPPPGTGDCNTKYALNVYSVHNLSTGRRRLVDKSSETFHNQVRLSTETVDNSSDLWIKPAVTEECRQVVAFDPRDACGYLATYPQFIHRKTRVIHIFIQNCEGDYSA